ncbi:tubulin polyglutamylase TTLL11 isoform X3 [Microtus oregoni]|uniref:tubulin polyglutamylase TTLL11 isoform X3 n=1 Tax=Microtus oregoni TaxID=111838 RepID=UPI001BB21DB7|nr:tubulin polyglutamylase TTLL11 isoform X3 [Microtus oregoni]
MQRGSPERELAVAAAAAEAEEEQLSVDAGAAGEPERPAREEQPKAALPVPARPRAAEEGDVRVARRLPPALPLAPPRPAARALCQLAKGRSRSRGRGRYRRGSGSPRPVTVDSSKARTSLDALKISLRQLRWKEVRMVKDGDPTWKPTFIVKPDSGCQGDGIYLIKDPNDIRMTGALQNRPAVVQEYICKPLLIDKLKFDIRLYVLLKSLEPLEIYIAKDGLSRFCTEPYHEPNPQNLHHVFMHLTNYSLNIHSSKFVHSDNASTGSKRTFSSILCRLSSKGIDIKKVWSDIISLVIKTVIALTPELKVFYQSDIPTGRPGPTCFQILGFDILLMKNLKPMLLEVNANPSMRIEHEYELSPGVFENIPSLVDEEVKVAVIRDTLRLMNPLKKKEMHFPDICMDRKHRIPAVSDRMSSSKLKGSSLSVARSQHPGKPFAGKEDLDCDLTGDPDSNPEAHLPSICLKQVFPKYAKQFNYLRLVDRMANLFIRFLGIKGTMKLGPTGFRTFIRNCKLSSSSLSMAAVDILYIDITRRWNSMALDQRDSGMCLQAFVEAFFFLAQRKFKLLPLHEQVASLIDLCEYHLSLLDEKRLVCGRGRRPQSSPQETNPTTQSAAGSPAPRIIGANKLPHSRHALS